MSETWLDEAGSPESPFAAEVDRRQKKCTETWKALRNALPEPMQKALEAGEWIDAVRWGIHSGMRDVTQLTNIVFQECFGSSRGYCKLDRLDPKYEFYRKQWNLIAEQHVRPAFTFARPPDKAGPMVCAAGAKSSRSRPEPDGPAIDITGRYEDQRDPPRFMLRVNQAGKHVECLLIEAVLPSSDPRRRQGPRREHRLSGDLRSAVSGTYFELYDRARPSVPVLVSPDPRTGSLRIHESGTPDLAVSTAPRSARRLGRQSASCARAS
jgi:hypothetical protein